MKHDAPAIGDTVWSSIRKPGGWPFYHIGAEFKVIPCHYPDQMRVRAADGKSEFSIKRSDWDKNFSKTFVEHEKGISPREAFEKLEISEYASRIWHSNSHGELFHVLDYMQWAETLDEEGIKFFGVMFRVAVAHAEATWTRPESCFQHMPRLFKQIITAMNDAKP